MNIKEIKSSLKRHDWYEHKDNVFANSNYLGVKIKVTYENITFEHFDYEGVQVIDYNEIEKVGLGKFVAEYYAKVKDYYNINEEVSDESE